MSILLYPAALGFLSKTYAEIQFLPDYGDYHDQTGFTDECWFGIDEEDLCNRGFCLTNSEGEASCDCNYGWSGEYCTENVLFELCGDMMCFNKGECTVGLNGITGASCFCQTGYSGDNCEIEDESVDLCEGIDCSGNGQCVEAADSDPQWECECDVMFGGDNCGVALDSCSGVFLVDIFTRLAETSGNLNATMECGFSTPSIYEDVHPATYDTETFSYCVCAEVWAEYGVDDYENQLNSCVIDSYRPLSFFDEAEAYCPACDDDQDAIMESLITSKSATCYHFVYERETMPLYWRTVWKCYCMFSIGTPSTIETIVNCPFTEHSASSDYISYVNCKNEKLCEWKTMYKYFEEEYSQIDLEGAVTCKDWMEAWIFTTPDDHQLLEDMTDSFCPCMETLRGHCDGCDWVLNCDPITFHQLTMLEAFDKLCNDVHLENRDCINQIGYIAIELGTLNFTAATMCYSAMDLGSTLSNLTDNLKDLMCGCLGPAVTLLSDDTYQSDNFQTALACIDDAFAMNMKQCPSDLYDGSSYWIPVTTSYHPSKTLTSDAVLEMDIEELELTETSDRTSNKMKNVEFSVDYWESTSVWKSITIGEVVALIILSGTAFGLNKKRAKAERS